MASQYQDNNAAMASLTERLAGYERYMSDHMARSERRMDRIEAGVEEIRTTLAEARGGMAAGKWLFGGSLAAVLATFAGLYVWLRGLTGH